MLLIIWPLLIAVLGLVLWLINNPPANPKVGELGRILFQIGAFWTTYLLCGSAFSLGNHIR